jgi:hypothetical protein
LPTIGERPLTIARPKANISSRSYLRSNMPILRRILCFLAVVILLLSTAHRLPGPIVEVEETPTPTPSQKQELPKRKHPATSKTAANQQAATKPETRAKPGSPPPRSQAVGRLIVSRAPNFGWNISVDLRMDGRGVANIAQGRRYDGIVPTGHHVLTVSSRGTQPTSVDLDVQSGQTYAFSAVWSSDLIVLRPSR